MRRAMTTATRGTHVYQESHEERRQEVRAVIIHRTIDPPTNAERLAEWYAKALRLGYVITGPRRQFQQAVPGTGQALPCEAGVGGGKVVSLRRRHGR
jgi:hypothetical protein